MQFNIGFHPGFKFLIWVSLLFCALNSIAQDQSFSLPENSLSLRENILNVHHKDVIAIDGFQINQSYSMMVIDEDFSCEASLIPTDPASIIYSKNKNTYSLTALAEQISFKVDMKNCDSKKEDLILSFFCMSCEMPEPEVGAARMDGIVTDPSISPDELVRDVLIGGGCFEVDNVAPIGIGQIAKFTGGTSSIGFDEGVIITTGSPAIAHGPNNSPSAGTNSGGGSDVDLALLSSPVLDASGVQFSFTPTESQIAFNYVFASEEYCEFSQSTFNDVFGFFISGPGINGGFSMNGENIAVLPGGGVAVSINSINQFSNSALYVDNTPAGQFQDAGNPPDCDQVVMQDGIAIDDCQYDGFTGTLTAFAEVIPCETYLIRLVVGDVLDGNFDSAVFLEANSFSAGGQGNIAADIPGLTSDGFGVAYEGCASGFLVFNRIGNDLTDPVEISFSLDPASTAIPGVDFSDLPASIIIPPGATQLLVPFDVFNDFILEGSETIIINIDNPCSCTQSSITIIIDDIIPLESPPEEFSFCTAQPVTLNAMPTGGAAPYTYLWDTGLMTPSITVNPTDSETYSVTVTDNCGNEVVSEHIVNVTGALGASIAGDIEICGEFPEGTILVDLFGDGPWDLVYSFNNDVQPVIENITYSPYELMITEPGVYQLLLVSSNGCPGAAQGISVVTINEIEFIVDAENPNCSGENNGSINLIPTDGTPGYGFDWSGTTQLIANPTGLGAGSYEVTITDADGCVGSGEIILTEPDSIQAAIVDLVNVDCFNPDNGSFEVTLNGGSPSYTVTWNDGLPDGQIQNNLAPGVYSGVVTDSLGCTENIETEIVADFVTPIAMANPLGVFSCTDQTVVLSADGSSQDTIFTYSWQDPDGNTLGNAIEQEANQQGTYTVMVTNTTNGCTSEAQVTPDTDFTPPVSAIAVPDVLDCDTDTVLLDGTLSTGTGALLYEWIFNNSTISNDPEVMVDQIGQYSLIITNASNGCVHESAIDVLQNIAPPDVDAGPNQILTCAVDNVTLNGSGSTGSNYTYTWLDENLTSIGNDLSVSVDAPGTYTLVIENTETACVSEAEVLVSPEDNIPITVATEQGTITCADLEATLIGTGSDTGSNISYTWTYSMGGIVSNELIATVEQSGNYTLTVLNTDNGCESDMLVNVPEDLVPPDADAGPGGMLTCMDIKVELTGSTSNPAGHTFAWYSDANILLGENASIILEQAGDFTLVVTAPNGCTAESVTTIELNDDVPIADAGVNYTITCQDDQFIIGGPNTSIDPNLEYVWLDEDNNFVSDQPTFSVDFPGTFTLYVNNPISNCESFDAIVVDESVDLPIVEVGTGGILNCIDSEFILGGTGSSQGSEFTYIWTDENAQVVGQEIFFQAENPGTYTLTILNTTTGCESEESVSITRNMEMPNAEAGPNGVLTCDADFATLNANGSSTGSEFSYQWFNEGGVPIGDQSTIDVDQTGEYQLVITNTINGCEASDFTTVIPDDNLPIANAGPGQILNCNIEEVTLSALGSTTSSGQIEILWLDPNGEVIGNEMEIVTNIQGIYTLQISDAINGCDATATVIVDQDLNDPIVDAGDDQILDCATDMLSLLGEATGSGNFDYLWTDSDNNILSNLQSINIDQAGNYTFTVIDLENGCSATDFVVVEPDLNAPLALAGPDGTLNCDILDYEINATASSSGPGITYSWTFLGQEISDELILNIDEPGTYTLLVTDTNNGCKTSDNVIVTLNDEDPIANIDQIGASALDCENTTVLLDGINSFPLGNISFSWLETDNPQVVLGVNSSLEVNGPGTYQLTVENLENGCIDLIPFTVLQNVETPDPTIPTPDLLTCIESSLELSVNDLANIQNLDILWETTAPGGILSDPTNANISVGQPGVYSVLLSNPENGCDAMAAVTVISNDEYPVAIAETTDELDCVTEEVLLSGNGSSENGNFTYQWTGPSLVSGANSLNPTVNSAGTYQIEVTNQDNGCKSFEDVVVNENLDVPIDLTADIVPPLCYNDPGSVSIVAVEGGAGPYQYAIGNNSNYGALSTFDNLASGTYQVYIIDDIGCTYEESISIPTTNPIQAVLEGEIEISLGDNTQLNTFLTFPENELTSIVWTPTESLSCNDCLNPFANPIETTMYRIMVKDANGCPAEDDVLVRVKPDRGVFIPNAFSPNADFTNDKFLVFGNEKSIKQIDEFIVADRWGEIVFRADNFKPNDPAHGWDGYFKGELLNPAVFVYYAKITFIDGKTELYKGDVTLMK